MSLALSILLTWLGAALLWVAFHGIDAQDATPRGVMSTIARKLSMTPAGAPATTTPGG